MQFNFVQRGEKMKEISVNEACITNETIYGLSYEYSILLEFDISTYEAKSEYFVSVDGNRLKYNRSCEMWRHLIIEENFGYLIECQTNKIVKVDLKRKKQEVILLDILPEVLSFIGIENNVLYIYAVNTASIIAVNILNEQIDYFKLPETYIGKIDCSELKVYQKSVFASGYIQNKILEVNCSTGEIREHFFSDIQGDICQFSWNEQYLACITQTSILLWDIRFKRKKEIIMLPSDVLAPDGEMPFYRSVIVENMLILFPYHTKSLVIIDLCSFRVQCVHLEGADSGNRKRTLGYLDVNVNCIYTLDNLGRGLCINLENKEMKRISFYAREQILEEIKRGVFLRHEVIVEGKEFNVLEMLNYIDDQHEDIIESNVGEKIYRIC